MSEALDLFMKSEKEIAEIRYVLPSTGEEIFLRPFRTKEQKIILKALEKEDRVLISESMDNLLKNCVISPKNFNPLKLYSKDRECLLIKLQQESVKEDYDHVWNCKSCNKSNSIKIKLNDLSFKGILYPEKLQNKDVKLVDHNITLILGVSTREDEKNIILHAKKYSFAKQELSQAELLNATYASVIKGIKMKKEITNDETGDVEQKEYIVNIDFKDRLKILGDMSFNDKKLIVDFLTELEDYGYNLNIGIQHCKYCNNEEEQELEWIYFFIM